MKTPKQIDFNRDISNDKRALRRLFAAVCGLLALGVIVFGVIFALNDFSFEKLLGAQSTTAQPIGGEPAEADPAAPFSDENAVNIMLLGHNEKSLSFCTLLSFSAAENSVKVKPVSPALSLELRGQKARVEDIFSLFGAAEVADALSEKYAPVHRWISVSDSKLKTLLQALGPIRVQIPADIDISVDAIRYQYRKGERELTADAAVTLMHSAFSGDAALFFQAQVVAGALKTHLNAETLGRGESFFSELINMVDGNVTAFDYAQYLPRLTAFAERGPQFSVIS